MHVRPMTDHDISAVIAINQAGVPGVSPLTAFDLSKVKRQGFECWVSEDISGVIMGYLLGFHHVHGEDNAELGEAFVALKDAINDAFFYIDQVAVSSHYRRHGIGTMLYRKASDWAISINVHTLASEVNLKPANPRSMQFHQLMGFHAIENIDLTDGSTVTLMTRHLVPFDRSSQKELTLEWKQKGRLF